MKKIIFLIFISLHIISSAQYIDISNGDYSYSKIIEVNKDKEDIYNSLKKWLNNSSSKSKYIIDQDDSKTGIISYNETLPTMEYVYLRSSRVSYKVNIEIKDKKIRFTINNIVFNNNFNHLNLPDIKESYSSFLKDILTEEEKYNANKKLYEEETKARIKRKHEYEMNNAKNNLRSLNQIKDALNEQIKINETIITEMINKNDDW